MTPSELLQITRGMMEQPASAKEFMSRFDVVLAHLHLVHGNPRNEVFRVLFLNRKNMMIEDVIMGEGTIDHVPVYVREVIRRALMNDASAMVLCHNHPSGDPWPSDADISMTKELNKAAKLFGITIHDHIIIGNGVEHSMRSKGDF